MSHALLSLLITFALLWIALISATSDWQKQVPSQQGLHDQQHAPLLSQQEQQHTCSNLLDVHELHGEWVEAATDLEASLLNVHLRVCV